MPSFVAVISLLSLMSLLYSLKVFNQEAHRLQLVVQPFGGSIPRMMEQVLRVCIAALFTTLSLISVLMSVALIWLALQPGMVG